MSLRNRLGLGGEVCKERSKTYVRYGYDLQRFEMYKKEIKTEKKYSSRIPTKLTIMKGVVDKAKTSKYPAEIIGELELQYNSLLTLVDKLANSSGTTETDKIEWNSQKKNYVL